MSWEPGPTTGPFRTVAYIIALTILGLLYVFARHTIRHELDDVYNALRGEVAVEIVDLGDADEPGTFPRRVQLSVRPIEGVDDDSIRADIEVNGKRATMKRGEWGTWSHSLEPEAGDCELRVDFVVFYRSTFLLGLGSEQREGTYHLPVFGPAAEIRAAPTIARLCVGGSAPLKATVYDQSGCLIPDAPIEWRWEGDAGRGGSLEIEPHPIDATGMSVTALTAGAPRLIASSGDAAMKTTIEIDSTGPDCESR